MSEEKKDNLITVNIDGQDLQVPPGTNMVDAVAMLGKEVPHYCYHPKLSVAGNCRMCLVEMGMPGRDRATGQPMLNEDGTPKIMWMPGPAIACGTKAAPGMHIKTNSPKAVESREAVTEFLLINHPLDCPICDQAGECKLQEFSASHGRGYSRFIEEKNVKPKRTRLGPRVTLDDERCILCSRCVRFSQEVAKDDVLGFTDRGSYSTLTCFPGKELANNYSLNTVDICPVGALTSTDFRFKMRVWFLKETKSIDMETSVGCNTIVSSREGKIYRITPRRNDEVNDTWMPDSGRELYKLVEADNRLQSCSVDGAASSPTAAIEAASKLLKNGGVVAIVGSGRSSVEEQFVLKSIADQVQAKGVYLIARYGQDDGILVSRDRNPNVRGALATGLISELPQEQLSELSAKIDSGEVTTVLAVGEDLAAAGLSSAQLKKVKLVTVGTHASDTTANANVVIAGLTPFEKSGTVINQQFRIQKFHKAIPGPSGAIDDLATLAAIQANLSGETCPSVVGTVWERIAELPIFSGLSFKSIAETGNLLDGSAFDGLAFAEGKSLHFEPKLETAAAE